MFLNSNRLCILFNVPPYWNSILWHHWRCIPLGLIHLLFIIVYMLCITLSIHKSKIHRTIHLYTALNSILGSSSCHQPRCLGLYWSVGEDMHLADLCDWAVGSPYSTAICRLSSSLRQLETSKHFWLVLFKLFFSKSRTCRSAFASFFDPNKWEGIDTGRAPSNKGYYVLQDQFDRRLHLWCWKQCCIRLVVWLTSGPRRVRGSFLGAWNCLLS